MVNTTYEPFSRQQEYIDVNDGFIKSLDVMGGSRVLDLACGTGTLTDLIFTTYDVLDVVGLDLSKESLDLAADHFQDGGELAPALIEGTADCLPFCADTFDTVIMGNSLHNLPDLDLLLQEIGRVSRKGAKFAFNTSFFAGTFPSGTETVYHEWLKYSLEYIQMRNEELLNNNQPGIKRKRGTSHKAFSRKWLTPDEYSQRLEANGFSVKWFCHRTIMLNEESLRKVGAYAGMAKVLLSGYPVEIASEALNESVTKAFEAYGKQEVRRLWLEIVSEKM